MKLVELVFSCVSLLSHASTPKMSSQGIKTISLETSHRPKKQKTLEGFVVSKRVEPKCPSSSPETIDIAGVNGSEVDELPHKDRHVIINAHSEDVPYPPPDHPSYHPPPSSSYNHPVPIPPIPFSLSLTFNTSPKNITKPNHGLELLYFHPFIDRKCSTDLTNYVLEALPWYRVRYTVRGITINTPRYTTVFGKDLTDTPWFGYDKAEPRAIPPILLKLMQKVEQVTGETYNFALVNYYADGNDSISYHSDSESFLGPNPCIASISLGAPRDFLLRHTKYKTNHLSVEKFALTSGDMVVMRGSTQLDWQHSIPKRKNAQGRINITFRKGMVKYATQNYYQYNVGKGPMHRWKGVGKMVECKT